MKPRAHLFLGIAIAAALVVIGAVIWIDRMQPVQITVIRAEDQSIVVSVTGEVVSPGIVEVPVGSRLTHVIDEAGGFTGDADLAALNLAGRIGDGENIVIPAIGATMPVQATEPTVGGDHLIDLNTASVAELTQLPGIGDVLAARIVEYRDVHGAFTSIDQLSNIDGISVRMVEELQPYVTVSE
jgi:competence protein ComEA